MTIAAKPHPETKDDLAMAAHYAAGTLSLILSSLHDPAVADGDGRHFRLHADVYTECMGALHLLHESLSRLADRIDALPNPDTAQAA